MNKKNIIRTFLIIIFSLFLIFIFQKLKKSDFNKEIDKNANETSENNYESSNILLDVTYKSQDIRGNTYIISAKKGELDLAKNNVVFLENVKSTIILDNQDTIDISSDFGKYNTYNYDTIFSKNVIIKYSNYKITGNYIDLSLIRNSMIISKNVVFNDNKRILKTDVVEINIDTKDIKIFMNDQNKKVNIKSLE